jgi:predicted TIM-barrel fold metal-dependent hydrolase
MKRDALLTKTFPVFDCDAHINDPLEIWSEYVADADREAVRAFYWQDEHQTILNGRSLVLGGQSHYFRPLYNPMHMAGPQMNKAIIRKLLMDIATGKLTEEQVEQVEHDGAFDGKARLRDMDLMGIDQVMVIPSMMVMHVPFGENPEGARGFARAYNDWAFDYCAVAPDRLFPAAWLPLQSPSATVGEIERVAERGFRMGLIRPIDARHRYPNQIGAGGLMGGIGGGASFDHVFKALEETETVLGMHTFPAPDPASYYDGEELDYMVSPGELSTRATDPAVGQRMESQALSFIFEAQAWLVQVLLSGFLDRYPRLHMAILESNSSWLPSVLAHCDRLFKLHAKERRTSASRMPSEAFREQCFVAFESDEAPSFRQWRFFEDVSIWSSDAYHTDGADVWTAMREMTECGVPEEAQAKMLGANARRLYRIEPKTFVNEEAPPIERPAWFPQGEELTRFTKLSRDPRRNMDELIAMLTGNGDGSAPSGAPSSY